MTALSVQPDTDAANGLSMARHRHARSMAIDEAVWRFAKRSLDLAVSMALLLVALPMFALIAAAIKLDSPGPIFYRVRRVGYRHRPFLMLKFRKMHDNASGGPLTMGGDPRLTRIGAVLTRTRLDELPQLWDVFRGRMSLIGPRPEDPQFVALHRRHYDRILSVRPGITGLSQLAYAEESEILDGESPIEDYIDRILPQKLLLDTLYATRSRLPLDVVIIFWTVVAMLLRRPVAVSRSDGRMNVRRRARLSAVAHVTAEAVLEPTSVG